MSYITKSMTIIITLSSMSSITQQTNPFTPYPPRQIYLKKQGYIEGVVMRLRNSDLPFVEVYRGIPYAAPPVDQFRFMPPSSPIHTLGDVKYGYDFGPVCPQKFPDESTMSDERKRYFRKLKSYLMNQSEDCLYLNIYAPHQESHPRAYPVIVFFHGESFEWNSGNPYDGSVLAAYGQVVVVTLNFRLGILGFLKVEPEETTNQSNFGLVDQVAALLWIKANINAFGGDPTKVTLMGHGTGAVCASLLTISPMAIYQNDKLFHRVILMSGTALADWALVNKPLEVSLQIAQSLNCQLRDNFADCLRKKRLDEIMDAVIVTDPYKITFGPVVDNLVVPNDPKKSMTQYTDIFQRFELMYGVTEMESIHLPLGGDIALQHGMMESERDQELRKYMRIRCERKPENCFFETRARYNYDSFAGDQARYRNYMGYEPDRASLARDELLDILSDARTVAPIIQTGLYHSALNFQSYFYVFTHKTHSKEYIRNKTYNGDELPYVFGVPIAPSKSPFLDVPYTEDEKKLSMAMMKYFCNFAYTGNPIVPRAKYPEDDYGAWHKFNKDWNEFDPVEQKYIKFDIPISHGNFYRKEQMEYWNEIFPKVTIPKASQMLNMTTIIRPSITSIDRNIITAPATELENSSLKNTLAVVGTLCFLLCLILFAFLYYKWITNNKNESEQHVQETDMEQANEHHASNYCWISKLNLSKLFFKPMDETYDEVDMDVKSASAGKLTRAMSNSTIDAHAKVRNWIAKEIAIKYSPKAEQKAIKRKEKETDKIRNEPIEFPVEIELDKCPTRPVSSDEETFNAKSLLIKTASIDRSNHRRRPDKVSVAIDATPSGRGPSVLAQQPIELTKSFDFPKMSPAPLRRSVTVDDFSTRNPNRSFDEELRKSSSSINLKSIETEPTLVRIEHGHSKSDPVHDIDYSIIKKLKTFDPSNDINVTSRPDNEEQPPPLSPAEALKTIKRRNFPKVLPDHPGRLAFINKRRSMPVHNLHLPSMDINQYSNSEPYSPSGRGHIRFPPVPPPRISTLTKQISNPQTICHSEPTLAEEPPASPEPEVTCNNLYVGPLIPRNNRTNSREKLTASQKCLKVDNRPLPKTIVTTNPNNPIKRTDPKIIVKPTINRNEKSIAKHIPRVVVPDNKPEIYAKPEIIQKNRDNDIAKYGKVKKSNIPTLVKSSNLNVNKGSSSSESNSPSSENSDTGTVVKKT